MSLDDVWMETWTCPECNGRNDDLTPCDYCGHITDRSKDVAAESAPDPTLWQRIVGHVVLFALLFALLCLLLLAL